MLRTTARPLRPLLAIVMGLCGACGSDQERDSDQVSTSDGLNPSADPDPGDGDSGQTPKSTPPEDGGVGEVGLRRLSRRELDDTLIDLLGDLDRPAAKFLPEDVIDPFDNDFSSQSVSAVLIQGLESLAADVSARLLADRPRRDQIVGCSPSDATHEVCLRSFVEHFAPKALRRPTTSTEIDAWLKLGLNFAGQRDDFYEGVDVIVRMLLQHPHFIYRVEAGTATHEPGVYRLDNHEVATRLSYFLWGSMPDDQLRALADAGQLSTVDQVRAAGERLLQDERARTRIDRFHAMWLGYVQLPHEAELTRSLRLETRSLIDDVVFGKRSSWMDLFTAQGSYINDQLAEHYGMPAPGTDDFVWVDYSSDGVENPAAARMGLLSHGSFLSLGAKFDDTSPTLRGLAIRTRLLCQSIPPPPAEVDPDTPPGGVDSEDCKVERYSEHAANGACHGCHALTDPLGFGLENFDRAGRYRSHETGRSDCNIDGQGLLDDQPFQGPSGLAQLLVSGDTLDACVVAQLYRFAMGHQAGVDDRGYVANLATNFRAQDHRFDALVLDLIATEAFLFRREPRT